MTRSDKKSITSFIHNFLGSFRIIFKCCTSCFVIILVLFSNYFSVSSHAFFSDGRSVTLTEASSNAFDHGKSSLYESDDSVPEKTDLLERNPSGLPEINGKAFILYDALSGTFLVGDDCDTPLSPASTTKVLTILLALEQLDLDDTITVTKNMYDYIPEGYVRLDLVEGEVITVRDAIYASILTSANDACSALAIEMGGTKEKFADIMNAKAKEIGCNQTHFTNPFGFSDPEHLTSVHDMALIMQKALEYDLFKEVATTSVYVIPPTNKFSGKRTLNNGNRFISTTTYSYDKYVAGKTGYTDLSGHTIVAAAESDGRTLIGVIFGATSSEIRYSNLIDLFEYGFSRFTTTAIDTSEYDSVIQEILVQVENVVEEYDLHVSDHSEKLQSYITVTAERALGGYSTNVDLSCAQVDPNQTNQVVSFPIHRIYSDGTKLTVGMLDVTISKQSEDAGTQDTDAKNNDEWVKKIQTAIIAILIVIGLLIALSVFVKIQKRRRAIQNRRRSKIL